MLQLEEPKLGEIIEKNLVFVSPQDSLTHVIKCMTQHRVSEVLVGELNKIEGIIEQYELVRIADLIIQNPYNSQLYAQDMMNPELTFLDQTCLVSSAIERMQKDKFKHCIVTDLKGKVIGTVSPQQLTLAYARLVKTQAQYVDRRINNETEKLLQANQQLTSMSYMDALLEIGNRRAMTTALESLHKESTELKQAYSVILFDVDYFKQYNDHYGHLEGDKTLKSVTQTIQEKTRNNDQLFRYGGEELLLTLPNTPKDIALKVANRILANFSEKNMPHENSPFNIVTVSGGIATYDPTQPYAASSYMEILHSADSALYTAKHSGKNNVVWEDYRLSDIDNAANG